MTLLLLPSLGSKFSLVSKDSIGSSVDQSIRPTNDQATDLFILALHRRLCGGQDEMSELTSPLSQGTGGQLKRVDTKVALTYLFLASSDCGLTQLVLSPGPLNPRFEWGRCIREDALVLFMPTVEDDSPLGLSVWHE